MADADPTTKKSATGRVKTLVSIFGLIFTILNFICFIIAYSTPHWIEHYSKYNEREFQKMGLFEVCFKQWSYFKDYLGKKYNGCWWIYSFEYRPVWSWLNPPWLLAIQVIMSITLILMFICIAVVFMYTLNACPAEKKKSFARLSFILNFIAGLNQGISVTIFGIMADTDRQWLPHPDSNYLSWSFGFGVVGAFFAIFAGMCLLTEWMRLDEEEKRAERRVMTSKPGPKL